MNRIRSFGNRFAIACAPGLVLVPGLAVAGNTNLVFKAELLVKETYDSNVYLQDVDPYAALADAVEAFEESFVTAVTPRVALDWKPLPAFNLAASYAPEVVRYHSASSEDHVAHRWGLNLGGKFKDTAWDLPNSLTWIDGSEVGPTFGTKDGPPAIGGIPMRDRREALIYRNSFRLTHPIGKDFFVRPVTSIYIHDFGTDVRDVRTNPFYENYVDRSDYNFGLDVGRSVSATAKAFLGYRFGFQVEPTSIPGAPWNYDNNYNRVLGGLEGTLAPWLKVAAALGPDFRSFTGDTRKGSDDHHVRLWVDATVTFLPTKSDSIVASVKQYEQPAFGSPSVYEDITYDLLWRHKFSAKLSASAGFRAYGGDWAVPVSREDWIFTPSGSVNWSITPHLSADLAYSYDWVDSVVPDKPGREFTRHLGSVALKYSF